METFTPINPYIAFPALITSSLDFKKLGIKGEIPISLSIEFLTTDCEEMKELYISQIYDKFGSDIIKAFNDFIESGKWHSYYGVGSTMYQDDLKYVNPNYSEYIKSIIEFDFFGAVRITFYFSANGKFQRKLFNSLKGIQQVGESLLTYP